MEGRRRRRRRALQEKADRSERASGRRRGDFG
jgi:hypothetical protein